MRVQARRAHGSRYTWMTGSGQREVEGEETLDFAMKVSLHLRPYCCSTFLSADGLVCQFLCCLACISAVFIGLDHFFFSVAR